MMNKTFLFFLLLISGGSVTVAQDFWQATAGPYGGLITALTANSSGQIFAATLRGGIFRSTDNGSTWAAVNIGLTNLYVTALTVNLSGSIFAGTAGDGVFRSSDNGLTWAPVNTNLTDLDVRGLASGQPGEVFAGTYTNGLYRSRDNGSTWTQIATSGLNENLQALIASAGGMIFAGSNAAGISRSPDYGTNWAEKNIGNVQALAFGSGFYVFAGTAGGGVYVSSDNGANWNTYNSGLGNLEIQSLAVTSTYVFAGTAGGGIYRSSDNGKSWTRTNIGLTNLNIVSLFAAPSGSLYAGTYGGGVFKTTDSGLNWSPSSTGLRNSQVFSLGVSLRGNIYAGTAGAGIFRTTDDGISWSTATTITANEYVQSFLTNRSGDLFAGTSNDGIFRSTDNGSTWAIVSSSFLSTNITSLALDSTGGIWAATSDGYVYSSTNGGSTWSSSRPTLNVLQCIVVDPSGRVYVGANSGSVYVKTITGWTSVSTGLPTSDVYSLLPVSTTTILAGTFADGIYRTTNSGGSWRAVNIGLNTGYIYSLASNSAGDIFAGATDGVYRSTDNGNSWNQINTGLPIIDVVSLTFSPTGYLYAGTLGAGVYRTVNPTVSVAPVATTTSATSITATTATLNGVVALKGTTTTAYFEWGLSSTLASPNLTLVQTLPGTSGISVVTAPLTGLLPATAYYYRLIAKASGGAPSVGDILNFTTSGTSAVGSLYVTVKDADGSSLPVPAVNGIVRLFNSSGKQVGSDQDLDASATTTFTNVSPGSGYYFQVWHNAASMFGQVYWGQNSNISIGASAATPSTFVRNQPYAKGLKVFSGTADVTGQSVSVGTLLRLELTIQNPNPGAIDARGRFVVDRDEAPPLDFDTLGSTYHTIPGGNATLVDSISIKPISAGDYYAVGAVQIVQGPVLTDGMVWPSTKAFTVSIGLAAPTLASPVNGSTGISTSPTLSWNAVTGALSYQLQVSTSSTFQTTVLDKSGLTGTSYPMTGLANGTTYYWRVGSTGVSAVVNWSAAWLFTTAGLAPTVTTAGTSQVGTTSATLSGSVNPNGLVTDAWFEWGTTSTSLSNQTPTQAMGSGATVQNVKADITGMSANTQYYYHTAARNSGGTQFGATLSFATPPSATTLSAPADGASGQSISPVLSWSTLAGVTYHVQVAVNISFTSPLVLDDTSVSSATRNLTYLASNTMYYWHVRAKGPGGFSTWSSTFSFTTAGTKSVASSGVAFPSNPTASTDYRLVSFPGTTSLQVSDVLSGTQNSDWRIYRDNGGAVPNNVTELSATSSLNVGEGYWLVAKGTFSFSKTVSMPKVGSDGTYSIAVRAGWNIIGNPFDVPVQWGTVKSDNGTTSNLWSYTGAGGFVTSTTLDPHTGYYFFSNSTALKIRYPFPSMRVDFPTPSAIDWKVQFVLRTEQSTDAENYVGVASGAREDIDGLNQPKPPVFSDLASLSLSAPASQVQDRPWCSDFRPGVSDGQVWKFMVSNPKHLKGTIRVIGVETVPQAYDVVAIDPLNSTPIDLRVQSEIPLRTTSDRLLLTLVVGEKKFVESVKQQMLPKEFQLAQNYPNPFNPSTSIMYTVPRASNVRLEVVTLLGQRAELLAQGYHAPGSYTVTWTPRDQGRHSLSSGTYFVRLVVDGALVQTRKMMLLK